ncbi:hypothetical protein J2S74_004834 [Evansella vedderi]|uniref:DUF4367 domain-containing protein n=1 Tax=Evansella vedderi TaxID=38282 RepID=A0ABU0A1K7_9BACI|nr:hypothetical protein [Evansella vedderi]MDQ0257376.1 hypothetical protein [Evansella vedderi]
MGHLDEQLKQLRHVQRDDEAKMKTYHQAKAQLYSRSKEKSSRKLLGVPMALMAALFIGFLLTYQWFGNHFLGPAVDEGDELITDDIEVVYVMEGTEIDWNLEGSNSEAIVLNQPQFLSELKDILNAPEKTLKDNTIPGYPGIELRVEQVDGVISLFRLGYEGGFSYVWPADSEVIYQYNEALWNSFVPLFEADRDETEEEVLSFDTIGEALSFFGHENVEVPVNYIDSISNIEIMTYNSKPIEMLIHNIDDNDVHTFTFRIQVNEHMDVVQAVDPGEWVIEEHFGMEFLYSDAFSAANLFKWEEEYLTYIIEMYEITSIALIKSDDS